MANRYTYVYFLLTSCSSIVRISASYCGKMSMREVIWTLNVNIKISTNMYETKATKDIYFLLRKELLWLIIRLISNILRISRIIEKLWIFMSGFIVKIKINNWQFLELKRLERWILALKLRYWSILVTGLDTMLTIVTKMSRNKSQNILSKKWW